MNRTLWILLLAPIAASTVALLTAWGIAAYRAKPTPQIPHPPDEI